MEIPLHMVYVMLCEDKEKTPDMKSANLVVPSPGSVLASRMVFRYNASLLLYLMNISKEK